MRGIFVSVRSIALASMASVAFFGFENVVRASVSFYVNVNTNNLGDSIDGSSGYIDISFDPGDVVSSLPATATVTNFSLGGGTLVGSPSYNGDATGDLTSALNLENQDPGGDNSIFQSVTYGSSLSFDATLAGPALDPTEPSEPGTDLALYLFDGSYNPLLTNAVNGEIVDINIEPNAVVVPSTRPNAEGGSSDASITELTPSAVPEPGSVEVMLGGGATALLFLAARRRRRMR